MSTRTARKLEPDLSQFLPQVQPRTKPHGNGMNGHTRRERRHPPKGETARDRFLRIGQHRMKNVLRDLRLIGNLSSSNYDVTNRDIAAMHKAIAIQMEQTFQRFSTTNDPKRLEDTFAIT